jgi:hypothetical protein
LSSTVERRFPAESFVQRKFWNCNEQLGLLFNRAAKGFGRANRATQIDCICSAAQRKILQLRTKQLKWSRHTTDFGICEQTDSNSGCQNPCKISWTTKRQRTLYPFKAHPQITNSSTSFSDTKSKPSLAETKNNAGLILHRSSKMT